MRELKGCWWVRADLTLPEAAKLALAVVRQLPHDELTYCSWSEIEFAEAEPEPESPSGAVFRSRTPTVVIDRDLEHDWRRITLLASPESLPTELEEVGSWKRLPEVEMRARLRQECRLGPLLPPKPSLFAGGLISLSAEPPEGFFAAATSAEFARRGYPQKPADEARVWLYRVPDSRPRSYFDFLFASPDRPQDTSRAEKFLIASGLGPANDPTSPGGAEADLLWLGDEQHGPLHEYLQCLARHDLRLSDLGQHRGLAQRLPDGSSLLSGMDQTHALSRQGFDALETDPERYRRVYSREYDDYLRSLFNSANQAPANSSYLLATSRGCTQGCALCCSGGLKAFQSFSAERIMAELHKLVEFEQPEAEQALDVFFLDSNFNNNPRRLVEFASAYSNSSLSGQFRFFVRHNTVNGFLQRGQNGAKVPNVELIEAFKTLGINEIFMGVDTFDEASTLTLKSNRVQLVRRGADTRATYTPDELYQLVGAMQRSGALIRTFYLQNNPWVSDYDRLDSYFNIARLWLDFPNFSIDTRHREVNQLKPFAGSPIAQVSQGRHEQQGRYVASGVVGEMDSFMTLTYFGLPQCQSDREQAVQSFKTELSSLRNSLTEVGAERLLSKLLTLEKELPEVADPDFHRNFAHLPPFDPEWQQQAFTERSEELFTGLRETLPY